MLQVRRTGNDESTPTIEDAHFLTSADMPTHAALDTNRLLLLAEMMERAKRTARRRHSTTLNDAERAYWRGRLDAHREDRDLLESATIGDADLLDKRRGPRNR